jgi:hypothetical protein
MQQQERSLKEPSRHRSRGGMLRCIFHHDRALSAISEQELLAYSSYETNVGREEHEIQGGDVRNYNFSISQRHG